MEKVYKNIQFIVNSGHFWRKRELGDCEKKRWEKYMEGMVPMPLLTSEVSNTIISAAAERVAQDM